MTKLHTETHRRGAVGAGLCAMIAASVLFAACSTDRFLDVNAPSRVPVETLDSPGNAGLMVNSAIGDFECAFGSAVIVEAVISDELADAQLGAAAWPYDRRDANTQTNGSYGVNPCTNNQTPGIYTPLSTARWAADNAVTKLGGWTDAEVQNRGALLAQAALYAGFSYAMIGMSMCDAAFDLQAPVNQAAIFALAEQRFTTAITTAGAAASVVNAAYVGRARVRLFLNNKTGAAADAALVPSGFVFNAGTGSNDNRRYNRIFAATGQFGFYTVEAISRALTTENGQADPRSATITMTTRPADAKSLIVEPAKYSAYTSPIRIASYDEAQLILAEAQAGAAAVTIINNMRAAPGVGLSPYTGPTDATSIQNLVIAERRRVLFVEGFRNYDIQRFNIPLNPPSGTVYPLKGGFYGTTTCLPLPDIERFNNPNVP
jgi:hypothetical protein